MPAYSGPPILPGGRAVVMLAELRTVESMTVQFTTVVAGQRHTRTTFSRALVCSAPDWVARIGSSGGEHTLETCAPCQIAAWLRESHPEWRSGVEPPPNGEQTRSADGTFGMTRGYDVTSAELAEALTDDEYAFLTSKQSERIMRIAQFCAVRRIPEMLREMHAYKALALRQAASCPDVAEQCVLRSLLASSAATILWDRWKQVVADRVVLARLRFELTGLWEVSPSLWSRN